MFDKHTRLVYKEYSELNKELPNKSYPIKIPGKMIMNNRELSNQKYSLNLNKFNPDNPCSPNSWDKRLFTRLCHIQKK